MLIPIVYRGHDGETCIAHPQGYSTEAQVFPAAGGVEISPATRAQPIVVVAGTPLKFTLTAKDGNGNIITDWNTTGSPVTVMIVGATANVDTSMQSWNHDPWAYSFALLMNKYGLPFTSISANEYTVPATAFINGMLEISFVCTKAESGVSLEVSPRATPLQQTSASMSFLPGALDNFLLDLTGSTARGNQVYLKRHYEIVVIPRDRFMNYVKDRTVCRFAAGYPDEMDSTAWPGAPALFRDSVVIVGMSSYFFTSSRNAHYQMISCRTVAADSIRGESPPFEVLRHPPNPFPLQVPVDHDFLYISTASDRFERFLWVKAEPPDPYTNIQLSRFHPTLVSDDVRYTVVFTDSSTLSKICRVPSDSSGIKNTYTPSHRELSSIVDSITATPNTRSANLVWWVEATDGIDTMRSYPPHMDPNVRPGYHLWIEHVIPSEAPELNHHDVLLSQAYPNPVTARHGNTLIAFELPGTGHAVLSLFDALGHEISRVVDAELASGSHTVSLPTGDLPSGVYFYRLMTAGSMLQRRVSVVK